MCVTVQQNLNILDFESEPSDVLLDLWRGLGKAAVEQEMAASCCDQEGRNFVRADVIEIPDYLKRQDGLIHFPTLGVSLAEGGSDGEEQNREKCDFHSHDSVLSRCSCTIFKVRDTNKFTPIFWHAACKALLGAQSNRYYPFDGQLDSKEDFRLEKST